METVVPGHGPITDKEGIRGLRDYLRFVEAEARQRYDAGMGYVEAGRDIELGPDADWIDRERIVLNVFACYREFGATADADRFAALSAAARYYFDERAGRMQPREARADRENGR